ncbi:hypothetical protein DPMN_110651 [Dreissena polymorpha]|uniref:Uncharacterized protein n=1 Tax=Dreissena polymorpha TaxID=45954 RepID=A0A9D4QN87_DREPO|nr:hypothetical protein DPMN_110651 [Dreissena polymorpha]
MQVLETSTCAVNKRITLEKSRLSFWKSFDSLPMNGNTSMSICVMAMNLYWDTLLNRPFAVVSITASQDTWQEQDSPCLWLLQHLPY